MTRQGRRHRFSGEGKLKMEIPVNLTVPYFVIAEQDGDVYVEMRSLSLSNALPSGLGFLQSILVKLPRQTVINTLEVTRAALKGKR